MEFAFVCTLSLRQCYKEGFSDILQYVATVVYFVDYFRNLIDAEIAKGRIYVATLAGPAALFSFLFSNADLNSSLVFPTLLCFTVQVSLFRTVKKSFHVSALVILHLIFYLSSYYFMLFILAVFVLLILSISAHFSLVHSSQPIYVCF